ncbi:PhnA protein [Brumimicrobium salinarum]|uniref:PhnA protein n=1 Tax=Brumimicrobium salinarum TaxID=2058658 RepID=A0A2I0R6Y0_9FLAO|nr:alkylphosphonate utilization protein [Brumimicrobium salinarum]PKR82324.1 PhnA protein [Brumimicrobium salinarum]
MIQEKLQARSNNQCELCAAKNELQVYTVPPKDSENEENSILICETCHTQITDETKVEPNHWRCLNDSMWSEVEAVKVVAWRMLDRLRGEGWPADLIDMMYLDDETLAWAKEGADEEEEDKIVHKDSNGVVLEAGDTVVLIKDLPVKGSSMVAKRGTAVRRISLDHNNANHIEGRVDGQQIVILTQFVKKS